VSASLAMSISSPLLLNRLSISPLLVLSVSSSVGRRSSLRGDGAISSERELRQTMGRKRRRKKLEDGREGVINGGWRVSRTRV